MAIDPEAARSAILNGLPSRARWWVGGTPLDFAFGSEAGGLRRPTPDDFGGNFDDAWRGLLLLGTSDYAEGGGAFQWLTLRESDGAVVAIHEFEDALIPYNSTVERFVRTFALLDAHLDRGRPLPAGVGDLAREIDPDAYPTSEWRSLVDHLLSL